MRQRSEVAKDSTPVRLLPEAPVGGDDPVRHRDGVEIVVDAPARLEVEQLAGDVHAGDLEVVLALPVREPARVELTGLGVDQVGGEGARVATEEGVRERDVTPEEPDDVQAHQEQRERVHEAGRRVGAQCLREQRAVGGART